METLEHVGTREDEEDAVDQLLEPDDGRNDPALDWTIGDASEDSSP